MANAVGSFMLQCRDRIKIMYLCMVFVALPPDWFSKAFQSSLLQTAVPEQQKAALSDPGRGISMGMFEGVDKL